MKNKFFPATLIQSFLLIILGLFLATPFASPFIFLEKQIDGFFVNEISLTIIYVIVLNIMILLAFYVNKKRKLSFNFNFKLNHFNLLLFIFLLFTFQLGINLPAQKVFHSLIFSEIIKTKSFYSFIYILGALSFGPILEEILFRGIILKGLLYSYSPWKAIILSSVIFGIIHGRPIVIPGAIFFGIFLGYVYYKTNSLGITILLHFLTNLFGLIGSYINYSFGSPNFNMVSDLYGDLSWFLIIFLVIMFIITSYFLVEKFIKNQLFIKNFDNSQKS
jgi:membrane protease YdiL (CAAX protease family)